MSISVAAIIVAYNSEAVIGQCLGSLRGQENIASILVVDNCSSDDTCELIRKDFSKVTLVESPRNEGFGRANNVALAKVQTDYVLLINPDAALEKDTLKHLLEAAVRYPDAAILAPQLYDESGTLFKSYKQNVFHRERKKGKFYPLAGDICAEFLSGAVWLLNMKHLRQVGFFDPQIFLYYEDDDLCLRVRKAGLGLVLVEKAKAQHHMGASSGEIKKEAAIFRQQQMAWSRLYIEYKYHGKEAALKLARKQRLEYAAKASLYTLLWNQSKINRYRARIKGVFEFTEALAGKKIT